jgi:hypothetical protein
MEAKVLAAHVPRQLASWVDRLAMRRSAHGGWNMKMAVTTWLDQEEERRRLTLDALADVDACGAVC